ETVHVALAQRARRNRAVGADRAAVHDRGVGLEALAKAVGDEVAEVGLLRAELVAARLERAVGASDHGVELASGPRGRSAHQPRARRAGRPAAAHLAEAP